MVVKFFPSLVEANIFVRIEESICLMVNVQIEKSFQDWKELLNYYPNYDFVIEKIKRHDELLPVFFSEDEFLDSYNDQITYFPDKRPCLVIEQCFVETKQMLDAQIVTDRQRGLI